jgi:hypothetical protein
VHHGPRIFISPATRIEMLRAGTESQRIAGETRQALYVVRAAGRAIPVVAEIEHKGASINVLNDLQGEALQPAAAVPRRICKATLG